MLITTDTVSVDAFAAGTGWVAKPEGLCKGERCVPAPGSLSLDGLVDRGLFTGSLLGFVNVPLALWVDANGDIVRPAEAANVTPNSLKGKPLLLAVGPESYYAPFSGV